jgi:DNA replication protein DnaC
MEAAGIAPRECTAAIADPPARRFEPEEFQKAAHTAGVEWARNGGILTIAGPMGTGKTTLAARAALRRLAYGHPLRWRITAEIVSGLWANDPMVRAASEQLLYRGTGALVLDDLDIQRTTGAAMEALGGLVDRWYRTEQPLLITTNAPSRDGLAKEYGRTGQRIASRLGAGTWIDVRGTDLRANQDGPN